MCEQFVLPSDSSISFGSPSQPVEGVIALQCDHGYVPHGYTTWQCNSSVVWQPVGQFFNASMDVTRRYSAGLSSAENITCLRKGPPDGLALPLSFFLASSSHPITRSTPLVTVVSALFDFWAVVMSTKPWSSGSSKPHFSPTKTTPLTLTWLQSPFFNPTLRHVNFF